MNLLSLNPFSRKYNTGVDVYNLNSELRITLPDRALLQVRIERVEGPNGTEVSFDDLEDGEISHRARPGSSTFDTSRDFGPRVWFNSIRSGLRLLEVLPDRKSGKAYCQSNSTMRYTMRLQTYSSWHNEMRKHGRRGYCQFYRRGAYRVSSVRSIRCCRF